MTESGFSKKPRRGAFSSEPDDGGFETMRPAPAASPPDSEIRRERLDARRGGVSRGQPPSSDDFETLSRPKPRGPSLKARAVGYLSRREHARIELARKLQPYAEDPADIQRVLDELEKEGWLSTERFAQSLVHRRASRQGTARIVQELRQHGVAEEQVAQLRDDLRSTEASRCQEVWRKRFDAKPVDRNAYAKQARFLAGRGFSHDVIRRILGDTGDDD
jgi:regulatory protein